MTNTDGEDRAESNDGEVRRSDVAGMCTPVLGGHAGYWRDIINNAIHCIDTYAELRRCQMCILALPVMTITAVFPVLSVPGMFLPTVN